MGEIDELRAKAIASMSSSANPSSSLKGKSPGNREDGELSSGEDQELPTCSYTPSETTALKEPTQTTALRDMPTQSMKAGNHIPKSSSRVATKQLRTPLPRTYTNNFKAKQMQFKSSNSQGPCWHGKGMDDNLVICFSDNDSGSDSEESEQEKNLIGEGNTFSIDRSQMKIALVQPQTKVLNRQTINRTKQTTRKRTLHCGPIASINKTRAGHHTVSLAEKDSRTQRHNPVVKSSVSREHEHVRDESLAVHKLENLRHQIALRENELKVPSKSMPENMERIKGLNSDSSSLDISKTGILTAGNRISSVPLTESASDERATKRLKLDENLKNKQCSDAQLPNQMPSARSLCELSKDRKATNAMSCHEGLKENGRPDPQLSRGYQVASRNDSVSFKASLNGEKTTESLLLTASSTLRDVKEAYKHVSIPASDISCSQHRSDNMTIPVDPTTVQSQHLSQMAPNVVDKALDQSDTPFHVDFTSESPGHSSASRRADVPNLLQNQEAGDFNLANSQQIVSKTCVIPMETSDGKYSVHVPYHKLDEVNQINVSGVGSMQLESLMNLEDLEDKALAEAQEQRYKCELEERLALKAYRKAQMNLVDANERCTFLYRNREFLSAQLRALIMEASSSMWPSSWPNDTGAALASVKNISNANFDPLASLSRQMPAKGLTFHRSGYDQNRQSSDGTHLDASSQQMREKDIDSDHCSEPDDATMEPRNNGAMSSSCNATMHHNTFSGENDARFPFDNRSVDLRLASDVMEVSHNEKIKDMNVEPERSPSSNSQEYELLEAALRSKLVARFSMRPSSKLNNVSDADCTVSKGADIMCENKEPAASLEQRLHEGDKKQRSDLAGIELSGRSDNQLIARSPYQPHDTIVSLCDQSHMNTDPEENNSFHKEPCKPSNATLLLLSPLALRSVSRHAKFILRGCCNELPTVEDNCYSTKSPGKIHFELVPYTLVENSSGYNLRSEITGELDSHMCDLVIDPFWPFCMFELRGKCNDEECSLQHVRNFTKGNLKYTDHSDDLSCGKPTTRHGLWHHIQSVPVYQIGSNLIRVDVHLSRNVLAQSTWQYWQSGFCASFSLPFSVQRILIPTTPFQQFDDGPTTDDPAYFKSQDHAVKQLFQGGPSIERSLEMALDLFNGKVYKPDAKKAISLLSQAMKDDPTSVVLWVVYLHILHRTPKGVGENDMLCSAVDSNEGSYDLWLMYINSRVELCDRLSAYDNALAVFYKRGDVERNYASACILDIFLQMIDFLCMSGNVDKAVSRIYRLLPNSESTGDVDTHSCLVGSDRCIFWVSCTYVAIYGKLPEPIVRKLEFEKDLLFEIEWPSAFETSERKDRALEMIEVGMDDLLSRDPTDLKSLHFLAASHVRCAAALEEPSADLLVRYLKLYPTCIEIVLMSARLQGFEKPLSDWPKESPGLQCLWNQYAEHALQNREMDFSKKLMSSWFRDFQSAKDQEDEAFRFLNLFLYHLLQENPADARVAIDEALKLSSIENYKHFVSEHAAFLVSDECGVVCRLLIGYMEDSRSNITPRLLSRRYQLYIKKPRVRQLVANFLGPVSVDFDLMNSVLEACYGRSLLPEKFDSAKDVVDFVESLMEIAPANYELALGAYRFVFGNYSDVGIRFWASSLLVNSVFQAIPVAPEYAWLDAADALRSSEIPDLPLRFHRHAVSVYPFSVKLWKSYGDVAEDIEAVAEAARERGVELG